jgi:hypothetical protein
MRNFLAAAFLFVLSVLGVRAAANDVSTLSGEWAGEVDCAPQGKAPAIAQVVLSVRPSKSPTQIDAQIAISPAKPIWFDHASGVHRTTAWAPGKPFRIASTCSGRTWTLGEWPRRGGAACIALDGNFREGAIDAQLGASRGYPPGFPPVCRPFVLKKAPPGSFIALQSQIVALRKAGATEAYEECLRLAGRPTPGFRGGSRDNVDFDPEKVCGFAMSAFPFQCEGAPERDRSVRTAFARSQELKSESPISQYECAARGGDAFAAGRYCHLATEESLKKNQWRLEDADALVKLQDACRAARKNGAPEATPALAKIDAFLATPEGSKVAVMLRDRTEILKKQRQDQCVQQRSFCEGGCWYESFGRRTQDQECVRKCTAQYYSCLDRP